MVDGDSPEDVVSPSCRMSRRAVDGTRKAPGHDPCTGPYRALYPKKCGPAVAGTTAEGTRSHCPRVCRHSRRGVSAHQGLRHALRTTATLRTLCGCATRRAVPSAATCSRAFAECARGGLATVVHDALVQEHLSTALIGHISRDATAIQGREKPVNKVKPPKAPRKKGRPAKGVPQEPREPQRPG